MPAVPVSAVSFLMVYHFVHHGSVIGHHGPKTRIRLFERIGSSCCRVGRLASQNQCESLRIWGRISRGHLRRIDGGYREVKTPILPLELVALGIAHRLRRDAYHHLPHVSELRRVHPGDVSELRWQLGYHVVNGLHAGEVPRILEAGPATLE